MNRLEWVLLSVTTGAVIGLSIAPPVHANPDEYCQPLSRTYNYSACMDEPQNDPNCTPYGDHDQCLSDWRDFQDQRHQQYPTPN